MRWLTTSGSTNLYYYTFATGNNPFSGSPGLTSRAFVSGSTYDWTVSCSETRKIEVETQEAKDDIFDSLEYFHDKIRKYKYKDSEKDFKYRGFYLEDFVC